MIKGALRYTLWKAAKYLKAGTTAYAGRNFSGRICVRHRAARSVRAYRIVDYFRRLGSTGRVLKILHDSYRTAFIGLILYDNGSFSYIILSQGVREGMFLYSGVGLMDDRVFIRGSSCLVSAIDLFGIVSNVELIPGRGSTLCRAAGTGAMIISKTDKQVTLKLRSGWVVTVESNCIASTGYVSNSNWITTPLKRAGVNRSRGIKPSVRGVAMNPCDHPHGGGNGKTSPKAGSVNPWGRVIKGVPTKIKKTDKLKRRLFKDIR